MVQIQQLQDKVGSVKDAKEFFDLETACSSGLFRFPLTHYYSESQSRD